MNCCDGRAEHGEHAPWCRGRERQSTIGTIAQNARRAREEGRRPPEVGRPLPRRLRARRGALARGGPVKKATKLDRLLARLGACDAARAYVRGKRPGPALFRKMKRRSWRLLREWLVWLTDASWNAYPADEGVARAVKDLDDAMVGMCRCSPPCRRRYRLAARRTTWPLVRRLLVALRVLP